MKRIIIPLLMMLLAMPLFAQQSKELRRSQSALYFPEFKDAKILQPFGRSTKAKANILLKNGALCYLENDTIMQAYTQNILGVEFDSVKFVKVDETQMGRVVATKGFNQLLCVTKVNMRKYKEETEGGENLPYLEIVDTGAFFEIDSDSQLREYDKGIPLQDEYYFYVKGVIVPAVESKFKKYVRPEMAKAFKNLMADRWWSWEDEVSLKQLLPYLPD